MSWLMGISLVTDKKNLFTVYRVFLFNDDSVSYLLLLWPGSDN